MMDDTISRQAAIEALGEMPEVWEEDDDEGRGEQNQWYMDKIAIEALPTAEPEIIRCGECKHNYVDGDNVRFNVCELMHNKVQSDDWYCADAERRSDG